MNKTTSLSFVFAIVNIVLLGICYLIVYNMSKHAENIGIVFSLLSMVAILGIIGLYNGKREKDTFGQSFGNFINSLIVILTLLVGIGLIIINK